MCNIYKESTTTNTSLSSYIVFIADLGFRSWVCLLNQHPIVNKHTTRVCHLVPSNKTCVWGIQCVCFVVASLASVKGFVHNTILYDRIIPYVVHYGVTGVPGI